MKMKTLVEQIRERARLLGTAALLVGTSFATTASAAGGTSNVTSAGCFANGECFAVISPAAENTGCSSGDQLRWIVSSGGAEMARSASAAVLANKKITFETAGCLSGFARANFIQLHQ
jgi:hypothetical protein